MKISEIKKRWKSETPRFFKQVIHVGLTVGAVGVAITTLPISLPASIITLGGYMVATGTVTATIAKLTVQK